ncbi:MAG TPA: hypothetical protein VK907_02200 [Phnomibacter sp.]|nr:hypothetical protein [Phnomibacter sp.]
MQNEWVLIIVTIVIVFAGNWFIVWLLQPPQAYHRPSSTNAIAASLAIRPKALLIHGDVEFKNITNIRSFICNICCDGNL